MLPLTEAVTEAAKEARPSVTSKTGHLDFRAQLVHAAVCVLVQDRACFDQLRALRELERRERLLSASGVSICTVLLVKQVN